MNGQLDTEWRALVYNSRHGTSDTEQALAALARAHSRATLYPHNCGLQWEALQGALVREIVRSKKYYQWCARMAALPEEPPT